MKVDLSKNLKQVKRLVKKYSPEILTGVAIVTGVTGAVLACKRTLDLNESLSPIKEEIENLKNEAEANDEAVDSKELTKLYFKAAKVVTKTYREPVALGAIAIISAGSACGIARKEDTRKAAALILLQNSFRNYRDAVIEDQGEEKDYMYYHGLKKEKIDVVEEDPETGKKKKVKKEVLTKRRGLEDYSVIFGPNSKEWVESPSINQSKLKAIEKYANEKLARDGEYWLGDLYTAIGLEKNQLTKFQREAARVVGWSRAINPNTHIEIGIFEPINDRANEAVKENNEFGENVFILGFNVDGYIVDAYADPENDNVD